MFIEISLEHTLFLSVKLAPYIFIIINNILHKKINLLAGYLGILKACFYAVQSHLRIPISKPNVVKNISLMLNLITSTNIILKRTFMLLQVFKRLLFLTLFFPLLSNADELTVENYAKLPTISLFSISPSGEKIAYRLTDGEFDLLQVYDLKETQRIGLIDISEVMPTSIRFIDENRVVLVSQVNTKLHGYLGRHDVSYATVFNISNNKIHKLLEPGQGISTGQNNVGTILGISKDGEYAYMPARENSGRYNLYRVSLSKKKEPRIHHNSAGDTIDFFMDEQGEVIARERYDNETNIHLVESKVEGHWVEIFKEDVEILNKSFAGLTSDRSKLVMIAQDSSHGRWAYYTLSLASGEQEGPLFSHTDKDVEHVITDINRVVHGVRYSGFNPTYEFFDKSLNARMRGLKKALPNQSLTLVDYTPNFEEMVFFLEGGSSAGDYVLYKEGSIQMLTSSRSDIPANDVHTVSAYEYTARDGVVIPSLLTLPNNTTGKNLPAIMYPHGGPESYDQIGFDYFAQYFASQGFAVIQPQFRGSKGFGSQHLIAGRGKWGREMQDDLTDAVNDLASKKVIDPKRVCIVGASYGGYAALAGATLTPDVYACAVSINGLSDIKRMLKTGRSDYGKDHWVVSYWDRVIRSDNLGDDFIESISPINHVESVSVPILLIHGERDKVVNIRQSKRMYNKLKSAKKDVTYVKLPKGNHHLSSAENRMKAMKTIDKFLREQILQ